MLSNGYILILIWVGVIAALAVMTPERVYRTELVNGERVRRVTPLFAVVAVLPLVIWGCLLYTTAAADEGVNVDLGGVAMTIKKEIVK